MGTKTEFKAGQNVRRIDSYYGNKSLYVVELYDSATDTLQIDCGGGCSTQVKASEWEYVPIDIGCWLDNHRGHYIQRDMIRLTCELGFIIGPLEEFALDRYEEAHLYEDYPYESLHELAADALNWLNSMRDHRIPGQNFPPNIPDGYCWAWNDGDFGLYPMEDDNV